MQMGFPAAHTDLAPGVHVEQTHPTGQVLRVLDARAQHAGGEIQGVLIWLKRAHKCHSEAFSVPDQLSDITIKIREHQEPGGHVPWQGDSIRAVRRDLPSPPAPIYSTQSLQKGPQVQRKGFLSCTCPHPKGKEHWELGEGKQRVCRCLCCSRVPRPPLPGVASAEKGPWFSLFGFFLNLQYGRAVQNGTLRLTKP